MSRLKTLFATPRTEPVFSLFLTGGFPEKDSTVDLVLNLESAGADIIELGMPFSDPLADGPTIQYASDVAIRNGVGVPQVIEMAADIRKASDIPLVLMGYINPVIRYGMEAFFRDAAAAGVDGVILPDVPVEESEPVRALCQTYGLDFIFLVAPNTTDERMRVVDSLSSGFVYCVSVTGVTGARDGGDVNKSVERFKDRVKANITNNPVLVGFGIKSHEDAKLIASGLNGFIIGSALIETIRSNYPASNWKEKVVQFVRSVKTGS
jgi:tryptophan synthase alpha chain